jgi:hypothetical protein
MEQGTAGLTVTPNEQLARTLFELSLPLQFTVVLPSGKVDPEGGVQVIVRPEQPLAVADEYVTTAVCDAGFSVAKTSSGQRRMHT